MRDKRLETCEACGGISRDGIDSRRVMIALSSLTLEAAAECFNDLIRASNAGNNKRVRELLGNGSRDFARAIKQLNTLTAEHFKVQCKSESASTDALEPGTSR